MRILVAALLMALTAASAVAQPAAGLGWRVPAQSMRAATYSAAPVPGDTARAECAVYREFR